MHIPISARRILTGGALLLAFSHLTTIVNASPVPVPQANNKPDPKPATLEWAFPAIGKRETHQVEDRPLDGVGKRQANNKPDPKPVKLEYPFPPVMTNGGKRDVESTQDVHTADDMNASGAPEDTEAASENQCPAGQHLRCKRPGVVRAGTQKCKCVPTPDHKRNLADETNVNAGEDVEAAEDAEAFDEVADDFGTSDATADEGVEDAENINNSDATGDADLRRPPTCPADFKLQCRRRKFRHWKLKCKCVPPPFAKSDPAVESSVDTVNAADQVQSAAAVQDINAVAEKRDDEDCKDKCLEGQSCMCRVRSLFRGHTCECEFPNGDIFVDPDKRDLAVDLADAIDSATVDEDFEADENVQESDDHEGKDNAVTTADAEEQDAGTFDDDFPRDEDAAAATNKKPCGPGFKPVCAGMGDGKHCRCVARKSNQDDDMLHNNQGQDPAHKRDSEYSDPAVHDVDQATFDRFEGALTDLAKYHIEHSCEPGSKKVCHRKDGKKKCHCKNADPAIIQRDVNILEDEAQVHGSEAPTAADEEVDEAKFNKFMGVMSSLAKEIEKNSGKKTCEPGFKRVCHRKGGSKKKCRCERADVAAVDRQDVDAAADVVQKRDLETSAAGNADVDEAACNKSMDIPYSMVEEGKKQHEKKGEPKRRDVEASAGFFPCPNSLDKPMPTAKLGDKTRLNPNSWLGQHIQDPDANGQCPHNCVEMTTKTGPQCLCEQGKDCPSGFFRSDKTGKCEFEGTKFMHDKIEDPQKAGQRYGIGEYKKRDVETNADADIFGPPSSLSDKGMHKPKEVEKTKMDLGSWVARHLQDPDTDGQCPENCAKVKNETGIQCLCERGKDCPTGFGFIRSAKTGKCVQETLQYLPIGATGARHDGSHWTAASNA